ncbi:MAG: hypothetical protein ACI9FN_002544, partial [Saprospiraceae bacterium]
MMIFRALEFVTNNNSKTLILALTMSFCAHVEGQIITDRTDQTENSFTVGARSLQIEPGMQLEYDVPNGSFDFASVRSIVDPTSVFRFVMTKG